MVLRMTNFFLGFNERSDLQGEGSWKPIYRGGLPKKGGGGAWTVCWFRGGGLARKRWGVSLRGGWYPNAHYDCFVPFGVIKNRFIKNKFKYFNGNCGYSSWPGWWILSLYAPPHKGLAFWKSYLWTSLYFSYGLKITCILLMQVISLKKMVVLSVKFTILIRWPPIYIPLILLSALMRLTSTSAAALYNNLDSWLDWRAHVGVKGSDRRPFILILDSILVYAI